MPYLKLFSGEVTDLLETTQSYSSIEQKIHLKPISWITTKVPYWSISIPISPVCKSKHCQWTFQTSKEFDDKQFYCHIYLLQCCPNNNINHCLFICQLFLWSTFISTIKKDNLSSGWIAKAGIVQEFLMTSWFVIQPVPSRIRCTK